MKFGFGSGESKTKLTKEQFESLPRLCCKILLRVLRYRQKRGTELVGDYRVRNDSHLGSDRPATRVTTTSYVSDEAAKNLADRKEHGLNQRIRVGVDARINDNTNIRVAGSASGQAGVDSSS